TAALSAGLLPALAAYPVLLPTVSDGQLPALPPSLVPVARPPVPPVPPAPFVFPGYAIAVIVVCLLVIAAVVAVLVAREPFLAFVQRRRALQRRRARFVFRAKEAAALKRKDVTLDEA